MPVYMIQGENRLGPIKIGYSNNPAKRLGQLNTSHWEDLRIIRRLDGGSTVEGLLHRHFAARRISREWFIFDSEMLTIDAETLVVIQPPKEPPAPKIVHQKKKRPEPTSFHARVIRDLGGKARLANSLKLDRAVLSKWHVRGIPSKYWHLAVNIGRACDPPLVFTSADLDRTKPDRFRSEGAP